MYARRGEGWVVMSVSHTKLSESVEEFAYHAIAARVGR